jgi:hypothetical protein
LPGKIFVEIAFPLIRLAEVIGRRRHNQADAVIWDVPKKVKAVPRKQDNRIALSEFSRD